MADADIRIPEEAVARLTALAATEGLSLRAYLVRLSETLPTPAERAERAEQALAALDEWNGAHPSPARQRELDGELDRRLAEAVAR